jgi:Ca2+-binding RTX toxin-like protein
MPGIDGSQTLTGGSGSDILSTLGPGVTGGVVWTLIGPQDPVDPVTAAAQLAANPGPVANAILPTYDAAGNEVSPATVPTHDAGAPSEDIETTAPTVTNDIIFVTPGHTVISGGDGDDFLVGSTFDDVIRGGAGNDLVRGGSGFDDIDGDAGNDTIDGGSGGSDSLLGGPGDDSITAHHDNNLLLGGPGNDTLNAGDGQDVLRGGQGDDVIIGGAGQDFISGDLGNDTETGGTGPDIFHGSQNIGLDEVTNFSYAKGDRVELDPGTTYSVSQVGANTVIDMGGGNRMDLDNVQLSSLHSDWLFEGTVTHV